METTESLKQRLAETNAKLADATELLRRARSLLADARTWEQRYNEQTALAADSGRKLADAERTINRLTAELSAETNRSNQVITQLADAEQRAGVWMRLFSSGRLPSEVISEFQRALAALEPAQSASPTEKAMNTEEQRVKIAEACGWKFTEFSEKPWRLASATNPEGKTWNTSGWVGDICPDYLNDLNAMAEAEKVLETEEQIETYLETLTDVCGGDTPTGTASFTAYFATAAQRAEAFLRCIGSWGE